MKIQTVLTVRADELTPLERTADRIRERGFEVEVRLGVYENAVLITNAPPRVVDKAKLADHETKLLGLYPVGKKM